MLVSDDCQAQQRRLVTQVGGTKRMGYGCGSLLASPVPSQELVHVVRPKARASCPLEWRGPRESGFT
ncbi:hypothetical protein NL676_033451 [Syzygium grande]|nr:hypothetical protein NL676_033451 [Syzygium grande]